MSLSDVMLLCAHSATCLTCYHIGLLAVTESTEKSHSFLKRLLLFFDRCFFLRDKNTLQLIKVLSPVNDNATQRLINVVCVCAIRGMVRRNVCICERADVKKKNVTMLPHMTG